ncbi:ElyC/SanA/YdcF family protein [Pantoea sp. SORGH_AS_0659]|uniref:ElyC/SanA/YdcF family protein n=1 Tax=Pantoea sp. SORGH_AS_0659 TaxID=3062597 RepID=UPI00286344F6|nr:ElyC/SanA/YdcF family protein [Pantoea sp. SORGH_AS_0659]MDR6352578.1 hypothetical protein [Pantoea sp. SORGH_AS_0659]
MRIKDKKAQCNENGREKNAKELAMAQHPGTRFLNTGKTLHQSVNAGKHLADNQTAKVMKKLVAEGYDLQAHPKAVTPLINELQPMESAFKISAKGKLDVLTQPVALHIKAGDNGNVITLKAAANLTEQQWLRENDKPGNFLVLNGNNDETYVTHIAKLAGSTQHLQFITSGFGGHGTTDRHPIAVNQTEAGRFKEILISHGVTADKIYTDHFSTNSGQNSINVAYILDNMIRENKPCNKIIIAGTPAAVFRQTYTYAQQLNIPAYAKGDGDETGTPPAPIRESDKQFDIESFPFADSAQYTTTADDLAVLREFSTTLNYMATTAFLPGDKTLFPDSFFHNAVESIQMTALQLEKDAGIVARHGDNIAAMKEITMDMMARLKNDTLTESDISNIKKVDSFFRNIFNRLELTFKRSNL